MIKITGKFTAGSELEKDIKSVFDQAVKDTIAKTADKVRAYAQTNLEKGYDKWAKGFSVDPVGDGSYILTVKGNVAKVLEEGWERGEISDMLRKGSRYKYNQSQGKDYVDVPIDAPERGKATRFVDADGLMKQFQKKKVTFSAPGKNPPVQEEDRYLRRVKDLIESKKRMDSQSRFLVIRRVNEHSVWPETHKPGVNALEHGSKEIGRDFEDILEKLL